MTDRLRKLILEWHDEKESFARASEKYKAACNSLSALNTLIYNQCKEEQISLAAMSELMNNKTLLENT